MKITAEPRSDQWNADDFVGGPRMFTVAGVVPGKAEQKYDIQLEGEDRVWRPPLTMLRLLIALWGDEAQEWVGRRVMLHRDPTIRFGRDVVGGIRISHLSHIDGPQNVLLTESRGKRSNNHVEPLTTEAIVAALRAEWQSADSDRRKAIEAEVNALQNQAEHPFPPEDEPIDGVLVEGAEK